MPKRIGSLPLALPPRTSGERITSWLANALRDAIVEGRLRPGARIPATRDLATQHRLSRGTVVSAFSQLRSEGYLISAIGSGTSVSSMLPDDLLQARRVTRTPERAAKHPGRPLSNFARRVTIFRGYESRSIRAFRANQPALDLFPTSLWSQVAGRRMRRASMRLLLGCEPAGYTPLREAIADYLGNSRGVRCDPQQVVIVSGAQEALDLVARLTLDPGDRVCMEDPGYNGARQVFTSLGAKVVPVSVDGEGIAVGGREWRGARLAYVTPAHQFPLGISMSLQRRFALLEWARGNSALIFEDDYDSEYRYAGRPLPALQGLDRHGVVCFAGTFSKVLFPALRLGYLVVPSDLVDRVSAAKSVSVRHAPLLDQAVLCDFMTGGHFARHIRAMREVYSARSKALVEAVRTDLAGLVELPPIEAGLQAVGWLPAGSHSDRVVEAAAARGVEATAVMSHSRNAISREGLQLGFGATDEQELRRGVRELAVVLGARSRLPRR